MVVIALGTDHSSFDESHMVGTSCTVVRVETEADHAVAC